MGIEDEIRELVFRIKLKHLDGKLAQDIRKLIEKARSAPLKCTARWYLAWDDSLAEKAREKVDKIWADSVEKAVNRVYEFSFVIQN